MTNRHLHIRTLEDLEIQERKVRKRIKESEKELGLRVKQLPEEIVTSALMKLVMSIIDGKAIRSLAGIAKKVGKSAISKLFSDSDE